MEKKTIFLELPAELIDKIDKGNVVGDRSVYITNLLDRQLQENMAKMSASTDLISRMEEVKDPLGLSGEISLMNSKGLNIGRFDINTIEGFENLNRKISEISEDHIVKMRTQRLL